MMPPRDLLDLRRVWRAAGYSLNGLKTALKYETPFRQEMAIFVVLAPLGLWLGRNGVERSLLVGSLMLVLIAELLNSAIEATVDRVSLEIHPLARRAKDLGSAAVMLSIVTAASVWLFVLLDR